MRFLVLGAGKIGRAVVYDLCKYSPEAQLIVVDASEEKLEKITKSFQSERISVIKANVGDMIEMNYILSSADIVISCVSHALNYNLAKAAIEAGASFCDLGGNEDVVRKQFLLHDMAVDSNVSIIPDCGLAPGMVSILVASACADLDLVHDITLRVGGLPVEPTPPLNYANLFPVEGLIDEYYEDCTVIRGGKLLRVPSLTDLEEIEFPAPFGKMEAFLTSGAISTLPTTFSGQVKNLDFKTIRYPGHCEKVRVLKELGFMDSTPLSISNPAVSARTVLAHVLEQKLPNDEPDVVLLRVEAAGEKDGLAKISKWECIDYMDDDGLSAVVRCSAFPIAIIAQMLGSGVIKDKGTLRQEKQIPIDAFLAEMNKRGIQLKRSERSVQPAS